MTIQPLDAADATTASAVFDLTYDLPRPPLTMNDWRNAHWRTKHDTKQRLAWLTREALQRTPVPRLTRARITVTQYAPDRRRRDPDGLSAFRKDVLDAIVRAGVLPDDNRDHVVDGGNFIEHDPRNPRIIVRIEALP